MTDDERARRLNVLSKPDLARRLDRAVAQMQHNGRADDPARELLLELQKHQHEFAEARQILEVSRDHYARLFELAPVGFAVFDRRGRIREINVTASQMLGRERLRLRDTPFQVFLATGEMRRFLDHVTFVIGGPDEARIESLDVGLETRGPGPAPAPQALRLVSSRRSGDDGRECFSALIDITAERRLERSKAASEHRARAILDALPAEVIVLDANGMIVMANDAWRRVADCPATRSASALATPPSQPRSVGSDYLAACRAASSKAGAETAVIAEGIAAVLERRTDFFISEYCCERPDGERWLALTAAPLDTEGQGAVILQIDVTDRKRAEQVAQITRQVAAHAARVNAVAVLATSLVHELAQPLNAAAFFGRAALERLQSGDATQATAAPGMLEPLIVKADAQIERAGAIVERLREFLRHKEMRMQLVALDPLIEQAMELTAVFARQRRVKLRFKSGLVDAWLLGDPVQLEQVMVNLICNGVQAIDEGGATVRRVTVRTAPYTSGISPSGPTDDHSPMVLVTVSDTGPGLDWETANALFDLFASARTAGLGMGLPISRDIVEGHSGRLWVEPDADGGALFHFMLPLASTGDD